MLGRPFAAAVEISVKELKIKTTLMFFTCITNFKPRVGEPEKYRNILLTYCVIYKNYVLLPALIPNQYPPSPQLCLSGRLGISTNGAWFFCRAFNTLEILKQSRPRQGTGSMSASKPAIRQHRCYYNVFLIKEGIVTPDFKG